MNAMNDVAILRTVVESTRDADGYRRAAENTDVTLYCKVRTSTRAEMYEAMRSGLKVTMSAEINAEDYKAACVTINGRKRKPSVFLHDDTEYTIVRAYQKNDVVMELSLSEVE